MESENKARMKDQMVRAYLVESSPEDINLDWVENWGMDREEITDLALSLSLCPIHFIDYAICFDDQNPACQQVRFIHPRHDT